MRVMSIVGVVGKAVILNEIHVRSKLKTLNSPGDWGCRCRPPYLAQHKLAFQLRLQPFRNSAEW